MLKTISLISCCLLLAAMCVRAQGQSSDAGGSAAPQPRPDPGWEFSVAPYFFLASLDGTVGVVGQRARRVDWRLSLSACRYFNDGFLFKTAMNGIMLGAKFKL